MKPRRSSRQGSTVLWRTVVAAVSGVLAVVLVLPLGWAAAGLSGWAVFAAVNVAWVLVALWSFSPEETRTHARREDPGRPAARIFAVAGSCASLAAVAVVLVQTRSAGTVLSFVLAGIAVIAVALSWVLIQVDYLLRYAAVYYRDPVGGIDFGGEEAPSYSDFGYFAFGVGVAYQVADTTIRTNEIRRLVVAQSLLAYLFGAVILATVVNLVTGLG